jgi:hypothetical protein
MATLLFALLLVQAPARPGATIPPDSYADSATANLVTAPGGPASGTSDW